MTKNAENSECRLLFKLLCFTLDIRSDYDTLFLFLCHFFLINANIGNTTTHMFCCFFIGNFKWYDLMMILIVEINSRWFNVNHTQQLTRLRNFNGVQEKKKQNSSQLFQYLTNLLAMTTIYSRHTFACKSICRRYVSTIAIAETTKPRYFRSLINNVSLDCTHISVLCLCSFIFQV